MREIEAGQRIKEMRTALGLNGDKFAEEVGITTKYLYDIEAGKRNFSIEILCHISEKLGVSCDYILFGDNSSERIRKEMIMLIEKMDQKQLGSIQRLIMVLREFSDSFQV